SSARVAPPHGLHVTRPIIRVHAVRNAGRGSGSLHRSVAWPPGRRLRVVTCMTTPRRHALSDLPAAAGTYGHGPLQTAGGSCVLRMSSIHSHTPFRRQRIDDVIGDDV